MVVGQYSADPNQHTLSPVVTGATVIGLKYNGGVMVVADTLACYGSSLRYKDVCRIKKVGKFCLLGASGEISDYQYVSDELDKLDDEDYLHEDGCFYGPHEYSSYIGRVMYNRRSKFNPLYNQFILVGKKKDAPAKLSFMDHQGTIFDEDFIATGFGAHLALPLLRNDWKPEITHDEAKALAIKCMQVCFYRDCKAFYKIQVGTTDGTTVSISEPFAIDHNWSHEAWLRPSLPEGAISSSW